MPFLKQPISLETATKQPGVAKSKSLPVTLLSGFPSQLPNTPYPSESLNTILTPTTNPGQRQNYPLNPHSLRSPQSVHSRHRQRHWGHQYRRRPNPLLTTFPPLLRKNHCATKRLHLLHTPRRPPRRTRPRVRGPRVRLCCC